MGNVFIRMMSVWHVIQFSLAAIFLLLVAEAYGRGIPPIYKHDIVMTNERTVVAKVVGVAKHGDDVYVEISAGTDDGIEVADRMRIYRLNVYLADIVIEKVLKNRSVGRVIEKGNGQASRGLETGKGVRIQKRLVK